MENDAHARMSVLKYLTFPVCVCLELTGSVLQFFHHLRHTAPAI